MSDETQVMTKEEEDALFAEVTGTVSEDIENDNAGSGTTTVVDETPEPVDTEQPQDKPEPKPTGDDKPSEPDEPELTNEQKEIKRLNDTMLRQAAAQSALQRRYNELENKSRVVERPKVPVLDPKTGLFSKEMVEEFPEVVKVNEFVVSLQKQVDTLEGRLQQTNNNFQQTQNQAYVDQQMAIVHSTHPDFRDVLTSSEFVEWRESLDPDGKELVRNIKTAQEFDTVIRGFKSATGYKSKAVREAESSEAAQEILRDREKRQEANLGLSSKQPSAPVTVKADADSINEDAIMNKVFKDLGVA